jgi:hypothetical protein
MDGFQVLQGLCGVGLGGVFPGNQVFDGGSQGGGDTVGFIPTGKAVVGYPAPKSLVVNAAFFGDYFLFGFLGFYEGIYPFPERIGVSIHIKHYRKKSAFFETFYLIKVFE